MRVFCPEHKRSFFAPRQSPVKCENRGHVLGELDFTGESKHVASPTKQAPVRWQYCCNCEHFCVIDDDHGLQRCPVCTRRSSTIFLCDRCFTFTFESITPLETKNFTLSSEGMPKPCCPGCLQPAPADLHEHTCDAAEVSFVTGLNVCPICNERLDISPSFPSTIADYLRRTKSANKFFVTFDYETELFVLIEDGEFVVITNNDDAGRTFLLPRATRLHTAREFYELYQDYYHCNTPTIGEISVTDPAIVVETRDGWRFEGPGLLTVAGEQLNGVSVNPAIERAERSIAKEKLPAHKEASATATPCGFCETLIEAKYAFCWKCGHPRGSKSPGPAARPERSRVTVSMIDEGDEPRPEPDQRSSLLGRTHPWTSGRHETSSRSNGSVLKLFSIAIGGLLFGFLSLFALMREGATATSVTDQPAATPAQAAIEMPSSEPIPSVEISPASLETPRRSPEDQALEALKQLRNSAGTTEGAAVLRKFSENEKRYARDYRFSYERARAVVGLKKNFRGEALAALTRAARKAIQSGKAVEMLENLNRDKDKDFQKLSRGQREWTQVQKALRNKDVSVLDGEETF